MRNPGSTTEIAATIDALPRRARIGVVRSGRGGASPRVLTPEPTSGMGPDDEIVALVYEPHMLLDVTAHAEVRALASVSSDLLELVREHDHGGGRQPGPPLSLLMHGPTRLAMAVVAHALARHLEADLVHLFASTVLPGGSGGSQPIVAPAVNRARGRRRSVLFIDQLESLATADRHDHRRQRALNDLVGEALRPVYGRAPVVLAAHVGDSCPPRAVTRRFEHLLSLPDVDAEEQDMTAVPARAVDGTVRTAPPHAVARHPDSHARRADAGV